MASLMHLQAAAVEHTGVMKTMAVNVPDSLLLHTSDEELARQSHLVA